MVLILKYIHMRGLYIYIFNNKDNFLLTSFSLLSNISFLSPLSEYLSILLLVKGLLLTYVDSIIMFI